MLPVSFLFLNFVLLAILKTQLQVTIKTTGPEKGVEVVEVQVQVRLRLRVTASTVRISSSELRSEVRIQIEDRVWWIR